MKKVLGVVLVIAFATPAYALIPTVSLGLSIREGEQTQPIGEPGTRAGSLEFVNRGGQQLILDGTWQYFSFDMMNDPLTPFTGDGVWDFTRGIIDAITIDSDGFAGPYTIWIDDLVETIDPAGPPPPTPIVLTDWEGFADGDEVAFQEPSFSGSTAGNLVAGSTAGVDNSVANGGLGSYRVDWEFTDNDPAKWLRLTQYLAPDGDAVVSVNEPGSVIGFWMMGVPEPGTLSLLGLASLAMLRRRR